MKWYDKAVFYHIYPLGLTGAPKENDYKVSEHRLQTLFPWISHIREIGCNALYIGPLFESVGHGYETTDYKKLDSRLGTNEDLTAFVKECHSQGIRVILDGVFNHTGRDFFAFQDIKKNRENSPYRDWYCHVNFCGNNEYNDGFSYENWGGYNLLVKLNQHNPAVRDYICDVIRFWVSEFDIDGIRLDAADVLDFSYMETLCKQLMAPASQGGGIKILDFSEVPSDILPLIVSLLARIVFSVQQWMDRTKLNPLAIFCDEAHLYIPANAQQGVELSSLQSFERIAKEGRKYGIGLVIVSQRPSEVNRTVLSQSSNFIAMRLTNAEDQAVIKRLLPDSIGNFADLLPVLDIGEAIAVGDASLLPSRIIIDIPRQKPNSATVKFWDEWSKESVSDDIAAAVQAMRRQGR